MSIFTNEKSILARFCHPDPCLSPQGKAPDLSLGYLPTPPLGLPLVPPSHFPQPHHPPTNQLRTSLPLQPPFWCTTAPAKRACLIMSSDQNPNHRRTPLDQQQQDLPPTLPRINISSLPFLRFVVPSGRDSIIIPPREPSPGGNGSRRHRVPAGASRQRGSSRNSSLSRFYTDRRPHQASQSWEEANAHLHLRAILEQVHGNPLLSAVSYGSSGSHDSQTQVQPTPNMASSSQRRQESLEDNRRTKRRRVDGDRLVPDFEGFRYGTFGQVEPGTLNMEIVSCDGGMFLNEVSYAAENILRNDASVYCTKGNRCNIVLRHQGATVFNLTDLIIKAPGSDYSSP